MNPILSTYYQKSIRLTPNGFSLFKQNHSEEIERADFLSTENVLITTKAPEFLSFTDTIQTIDIIVATHVPMLIPDNIYDDSKAKEYLQLQYNITHFGQNYSDQLAHYRALYFLTQNENSTLNNMNCIPRFKCEATLLYDFLKNQETPESILLSINDTFADVIVIHKQEVMLINRLQSIENADILYYLLNYIKQFGLVDPSVFIHYFYNSNQKLNEFLGQYLSKLIIL